ncbi:MAG: twin-arginine translocase subunit TatC [Flavobacteriales bacterium]|nr:twin-arginine translocase subunit TatC [Flavobacteriales bacterium]
MAEPKDMSFLDHLEELRGRLFKAVLGMMAGIVLVVVYHDFVVFKIIMGPRNPEFPTYKAFCFWSHKMGLGDSLCLQAPDCIIQSTTMSGTINADILVCIIGGFIVGFPWVFWQLWSFIKPGLKQNEVKSVRGVVYYVSLLFFTGVAFGYFILAPLSIQFLCNYTFADVAQQPTLLSYLKLTTSLVLGTGLVFQLPVLVYFLTKIGMVSSKFLKKYRKHAFVLNLIVAAIITPPDVTSQLLVAMPILLLYELSIVIAKRVEKRKLAMGNGQ